MLVDSSFQIFERIKTRKDFALKNLCSELPENMHRFLVFFLGGSYINPISPHLIAGSNPLFFMKPLKDNQIFGTSDVKCDKMVYHTSESTKLVLALCTNPMNFPLATTELRIDFGCPIVQSAFILETGFVSRREQGLSRLVSFFNFLY